MSQITTGTVTVTNASTTVEGAGGMLWNTSPTNIAVGDWLLVTGDTVMYQVASITDDDTMELTTPYAGVTGAGQAYAIQRDFIGTWNIPLLNQGDLFTARIFSRAMTIISGLLTAGVGTSFRMSFSFPGNAEAGRIPVDNIIFGSQVTLTKASFRCEDAPGTTAAEGRLTRDQVEVNDTLSISPGTLFNSEANATLDSSEIYTAGEQLGFAFTQSGDEIDPGTNFILTLQGTTP